MTRAAPERGAPERGAEVLHRGLAVLRCFADRKPEWGVRELAAEVGLPRSTVHRLLQTFCIEGVLQGDAGTGRYRVAGEMYRLAAILYQRMSVREIALPVMRDVVAACDETALLGIYDRRVRRMTFAVQVECSHPLRYRIELGRLLPVHAGATGRAILAFLPAAEIDAVVAEAASEPVTERTPTGGRRLRALIEETRRLGYAFSHGERIPDAVGVGAPVWGADGCVMGDLCLTLPEARYTEGLEHRLGPLLCEAAGRLSHLLGHSPPGRDRRQQAQSPGGGGNGE